MARRITITSGENGAGKTNISLNLSLSLASKGFKVCLFDVDSGLSDITIINGMLPKKTLESVILGQSSLNDIIIKNDNGIDIIPAGSGVKKIIPLTQEQSHTLVKSFLGLDDYDYFILDTPWDMSSQVLSFCMASDEIILVTTCDAKSITHTYSILKLLSQHQYTRPVKVVINQAMSVNAAKKAYDQLKEQVHKLLPITIKALGIVASDKNVQAAVVSRKPFLLLFPETIASKCINSIAQKLILKTKKEHGADINKVLSHIESRLSTLIREVNDIKKYLEIHKTRSDPGDESAFMLNPSEANPTEAKEISLDFESWLKKKYR